MLAAAIAVYNKTERTRGDLLQCEAIFLELLDDRVDEHGANHENVGYIHNYLGLVYAEMDDRFDQGEAHYHRAFEIYASEASKATVASNHASLLVKKAKLILEEAADLKEDARVRPAVSKAKRTSLRDLLPGGKVKPEVTEKELQTLRALAETNEEAMECYQKAAELRETVANLQRSIAKKAALDKPKTAGKSKGKGQVEAITYKSPKAIVEVLDQVVVGQHAAKRGLANAASQHLRRMQLSPEERAKTDKSNVLIVGPTGCGKTLLAEALAGAINAPFYRTEATKLTASGYVGEDVQAVLVGLLRACDYDVERAQNGIVYLDEIDKIAASAETSLDVGGESVQEELLTILEGTVISVPKDGNNRGKSEMIEIDTTNILFILGGAFAALGEIVSRRKADEKTSIGFGAEVRAKETEFSKYQKDADAQDLIKFGMIPEFVGRLPIRLVIETLTVDQLERILVEPRKALVGQKVLLLSATTDLRFTRGALRAIAEDALKSGTNGRALREIMEQVLAPVIFNEPQVAIITADMVKNRQAETEAQNKLDAGVTASSESSYVIDDDDVEAVRESASAAATARDRKNRTRQLPMVIPLAPAVVQKRA